MTSLHVLPVELVRAGHHAIPVEVLTSHPVIWTLTLGDLIVGAGTLFLAGFTYRLSHVTVALDERNAARERKRDERRVRGIARLVDGELGVVLVSLKAALEEKLWRAFYPTPHGAWDRDGAIIAETLPQDEAEAAIGLISKLTAWEEMVELARTENPELKGIRLDEPEQEAVSELLALHADVRRYLAPLAYPDARDLERDPDSLLEYFRERRRARLRRLWPF